MKTKNNGSSVQQTHPLLYWMTIVYIVGLPNFIQFDVTGRTHEFGLFNVTSVSRIVLTLLTAYVLAITLLMSRGPVLPRKVKLSIGIWLVLFVWCTITTVLQPESRLSPHLATDLPLSLFRISEWVLAFVLILALYTREPVEQATALIVELIGRIGWIVIVMVWIALPFFPHLVYGSDDNGARAALGGVFVGPGGLAFESCIAFYYALFFVRRDPIRWLCCTLTLITLEMTRSRTCIITLAVTFFCYSIFLPRRPVHRWGAVASIFLVCVVVLANGEGLEAYFAKGQTAANVASLDGRTYVWQASMDAIRSHPMLGYGFVVGAKHAIKDHWIYKHWIPPSAHSEFVESLLVGGIPAGVMVLSIYFSLLWRSAKSVRRGPHQLFLTLALLIVVIHSIFAGEALMSPFGSQGAVLLFCWIALADSRPLHRAGNMRSICCLAASVKL